MEQTELIVETTRPCAISGSSKAQVIATKAREGHDLRNVMSLETGLIYVDPLPTQELDTYYKEDYRKEYKKVITPKKKHIYRAGRVALDRWQKLKSHLPKGCRAIDIGAGGGEWSYLLKSRGIDIFGIEPSYGYGNFARETYGLNLFSGMYQEADVERGSYDVVTLFHVLEHLKDPVDDIREMAAFLKEGGVFAIEVPDILYPKMRFDHKWHDGHLYGFDLQTLESVALKAGLTSIRCEREGGNLFGLFRKEGNASAAQPDLSANAERALQALSDGKARYWSFPVTYFKVLAKLGRNIREKVATGSKSGGKEILDALYGNECA